MSKADSVDYLLTLAGKKYRHPESEALALRALTYANEAGYLKGQASANLLLGRINGEGNHPQQAIAFFLEAARLFESIHDSASAGEAYNGAANIYLFKLNHLTKSFEYCHKAADLLKHDSVRLQPVISNLASLYLRTGKMSKAIHLYEVNYNAERKQNDLRGMSVALNNLATAYEKKKEFEKALAYYEKGLEISKSIEDDRFSAHILIGISSVYCQMNEHDRALKGAQEMAKVAERNGYQDKQVIALQFFAVESEHLNKLTQAIDYAKKALALANKFQLAVYKPDIYQHLSILYDKKGNADLALNFQRKYTALLDSSTQQEHAALATTDRSSNSVSESTSNNGSSPWIIVASLSLVFPLVAFLYYQKKKANNRIGDTIMNETESDEEYKGVSSTNENEVIDDELKCIEVIQGEGLKLIPIQVIYWLQKEGRNYFVHTNDAVYRLRKNIAEVEVQLPANFFRINRTVIINMERMNNYSFWENHKYIIRMQGEKATEFIISRNRLREMKELLQLAEQSV
ncbi:MAG TPA: tetratricopeptide repeat protein [Cyclobacteriaceae bacterium]